MSELTVGRTPERRVLLAGRTRVVVPVGATDRDTLLPRIAELAGVDHDLLEWRVDPLLAPEPADVLASLAALADEVCLAAVRPVIATIRTAAEGGAALLADHHYVEAVTALATAADVVDVEIRRPGSALAITEVHRAGALALASFHDFNGTPDNWVLRDHMREMEAAGADVLKIACRVRRGEDVVSLLDVQTWASERFGRPTVVIGMGGPGLLTRIAGGLMGSALTFATAGEASAPGQVDVATVRAMLALSEQAD